MSTDFPAIPTLSDKEHILAQIPPVLTTDDLAKLMKTTAYTIRQKLKNGQLPFKNVSLTPQKTYRFAAIDVANWLLFGKSKPKRGRPAGSRNKATQPQRGEGA